MLGDFKKITIIHDLLVKRFPSLLERNKQWFWNVMFPISIRRSNLIGTVSNFSASEIEFFYPFAKRKLFVTAEGIRPSLLNNMSKPLDIKFNLSKSKYILCVATFAPHKNLLALVKGFEAVIKTLPEMKLVFIGKAKTSDALAYQEKIIDLVKKKGLSDRIVFLGHVDDIDFSALYSNAKATILPSLYEGFGLPIIESQFFGTPVLCSQRASMPEIAGDAAITFNPDNPSDIGAKIIEISLSESLRKKLSEKCADNIKRFTWENAANDLMSAIKTGNCQRSCRFF
jgi:glycosyltransferase involved in cell wall biosynthesis